METRLADIDWLEWSGLPRALNEARSGGWLLFRKLAELDCRANRTPGAVEISIAELAERCGLAEQAIPKIAEALRKKHALRCYLPEHPEEDALFEIRVPLETPIPAEEVARRTADPRLRDSSRYRYARAIADPPSHVEKVQQIVDMYFNRLSQKMNTFVLEQIEIAARRFSLEDIRKIMDRGASHNSRTMGWVLKELIRESGKLKEKS